MVWFMCARIFYLGCISLLLTTLSACNSGESFSDGTRIQGSIIDGTGRSTVLDSDPSAVRVSGSLSAKKPLFNVGYRCDGVIGFTGKSGIAQEQEAGYFVCPHTARQVSFFLGGERDALELGSLWLPCAPDNREVDSCDRVDGLGAYPSDDEESLLGPPLIHLYSLADILQSPARMDIGRGTTALQRRLANLSAMLEALDTGSRPGFVTLDGRVHEVIDSGLTEISAQMDIPFEDFVATDGPLDELMQRVVEAEGHVGQYPGSLSATRQNLGQGTKATAAGIYVLEMESYTYSFLLHFLGDLVPAVFPVTDALALAVIDAATNPDTEESDGFLYSRAAEGRDYLPLFIVDRQGRAFGGGGYDVMDVQFSVAADPDVGDGLDPLPENQINYQCSQGLEVPDYLTLSSDARVADDFSLQDFNLFSLSPEVETNLTLSGRLFSGRGFHGAERNELGRSDYRVIYPYSSGYDFDESDAVFLNGVACSQVVKDLIVNSFYRVGLVQPFLDDQVMAFLTPGGTPAAYDIDFWHRDTVHADDFPQRSPVSLPITIHRDGSIFSNMYDQSLKNAGYETDPEKRIPDGEYLIGLVTSVQKSDLHPDNPALASINILMNLSGPPGSEADLPHFGKRFHAQLRLDQKDRCANVLRSVADDTENPVWLDTWKPLQTVKAIGGGTPVQRYETLRLEGYGLVSGQAFSCSDE